MTSAADWFRAKYGKALANDVAIPLIEAWSGSNAGDVSPDVGASIPSSIAKIVWLKLAGRVFGRAVACGYSREQPENVHVWHVYPNDGISVLCNELAKGLQTRIRLESPVDAIVVKHNRVVGIRSKGEFQAASAVVSTAPVHILARIIEGSEQLSHLKQFRYRPMVFANLRFEGRGLLSNVVLWTPENRFPFFRLTETPLSMPWLAPEGKTIITADIGCEVDDRVWGMNDDEVAEYCLDCLLPIVPDARSRYLGCRVLRTRLAYPVFLLKYEEERRRFAQGTGIEGLYSVGRNGEFMHIFMEDVYYRTRNAMRQLLSATDLR